VEDCVVLICYGGVVVVLVFIWVVCWVCWISCELYVFDIWNVGVMVGDLLVIEVE